VRLFEGTATDQRCDRPLHFDAHANTTEDEAGVLDFTRGCIRTYKNLADRARTFEAEREVHEVTSAIEDAEHEAIADRYSAAGAATQGQ
jgi:xylose isomerase